MAEFKDRLEQALVEKGMKPSDLSRLTGIGEGAISQYRKGAFKTFCAIAMERIKSVFIL